MTANAQKTHCKRGHEYTPENTRIQVRNGTRRRICRACWARVMRERRAKKAAERAAKFASKPLWQWVKESAHDRIQARIQIADRGYRTPCWLTNYARTPGGYAVMKYAGRQTYVHRVSHEIYIGPIPDDYQVDHLCRVRHCVNPEHLEAVTAQENLARARAVIPWQ